MAFTGIQIFKYLPKKNCGECKHPTCLAFAMKLAASQAKLEACPYVSEEGKAVLAEASAPPIRLVKIGQGDFSHEVGEETVLFRHDKKFFHTPGFALHIDDSLGDDEINSKLKVVEDSSIERIGQILTVKLICINNKSNDAKRFQEVVKNVCSNTKRSLILKSLSPEVIKAGLEACIGSNPLIYAANDQNYQQMSELAKEYKCPLVVKGDGDLDKLSALVEKIVALGVKDIVLDSGDNTTKGLIEKNTLIRRAAIKKGFKSLGYPTITFPGEGQSDPLIETVKAGIGVAKYAGIIVLNDIAKGKMLPLFTLMQNIYTDPQQPMQVEENIYKIGEPTVNSPVLVTTNFSLTYFIVMGEIESSKIPSWLLIVDAEGMSVLTAWAADKFNAPKVAKMVNKCGILDKVSHRNLIIPGYVSILSGEIQEELPDWKIVVGPREANNIPVFLKGLDT
ncbi:MAG: acetyl-CoA decarbonylase/synthase complex subunit gamma [bacterium]